MPHRQFTDAQGRLWSVWDIVPSAVTFDLGAGRPSAADREAIESRAAARLPEQFSEGWLCFERDGEKRRLAPRPPQWATLPETHLEALCRRAATVQPRASTLAATPEAGD